MIQRTIIYLVIILSVSFTFNQMNKVQASPEEDPLESPKNLHTVEGITSGFDCAVVGLMCPSTHRGADYTSGLVTEDKQFYFVANIPQSFLTQYFLDRLEITGTVYHPYHHAIEPQKIYHVEDNKKTLVYEEGYFIDPNGHRSLFNKGRMVDGIWYCEDCAGDM